MKREELIAWGAEEHAARMRDLAPMKTADDPSSILDAAKKAATERRKAAGLSQSQAATAIRLARHHATPAAPQQ